MKRDLTVDVAKLVAGGGDVRWWARCGDCEAHDERLGNVLIRVLGIKTTESEEDFDVWWERVVLLTQTALWLADAAVPCEPQIEQVAA